MIRDFTKSALSFSWAMSLLGLKQSANLFGPGQQRGGNLLDPLTQIAVDQLDDSMKGIYRSGDNLQGRAVDMMAVWLNPLNWFNPNAWLRPFTGPRQQGYDFRQNGGAPTGPPSGNSPGNGQPTNGYRQNGGNGCTEGLVDTAIAMMNPVNWLNPNTWTRPFTSCTPRYDFRQSGNGGAAHTNYGQPFPNQEANGFTQAVSGIGQAVGQAAAGFTQAVGQATAGINQAVTGKNAGRGSANSSGNVPVNNESSAGWGPMPGDS
jgi:hypothetical protein